MLGGKSIHAVSTQLVKMTSVDKIKSVSGESIFLPVLPRDSTIKDILFYKPFEPDESVDVKIFVDNGNTRKDYSSLKTNELNSINLKAESGGIIQVLIKNVKVTKLVVFYV